MRYTSDQCRWHRNENMDLARVLRRCGTSMQDEFKAAIQRARWWNRKVMAGGIDW